MSGRDTIEFDEPRHSTCDCCGKKRTHLTRFVSRHGAAFAVYLADFTEGHDQVSILASFGPWGSENDRPGDRTAFAFRIWGGEDSYQVGLVDKADSGYTTDYFGRILDRDEALAHPLRQEAFDLSNHIVECDRPVMEFLAKTVP